MELPGTFDQISYHNLALRINDGYGFTFGVGWWPVTEANAPTAHWSYLYTTYVAFIYKLFGPNPVAPRLLQAVIVGILQPYLAYLIGRRIFNTTVGLIAAAFTAVYIYFVYYAAALMTEPFYITFILASFYVTMLIADSEKKPDIKWVLALGFLLGLIVLLRQLYMLIIPFQLLWLMWARFKRDRWFPLAEAMLVGIVIMAMVLPFTYSNYKRFNRFVLLNTNAGYAFYWANHPAYGTRFIPIRDDYTQLIPEELLSQNLDEAALDQELLKLGLSFITDDPGRIIQLSLSRVPIYFMFWPSTESGMVSNVTRVGSFGLLLPLMVYGVFLALRRNWSWALLHHPIFLLLLFALLYTDIHLLSWALIRYRLPVDAVLLIFAGYGLYDLAQRFVPKLLPQFEVSPS
ncbi:MAG: glycosyltransferase family 39 protein [Ardenticatenaceae bacterium]|nr:glycosyltransferase family 39 protein [Ardenticatenaceae bacterium]